MKKNKLSFLWAFIFAIACTACSDDDNEVIETITYIPFEISASWADRGDNADAHLSGTWKSGDELVALRSDTRQIEKAVVTWSADNKFTGTILSDTDDNDTFAILYPASASTVATSDTLTQTLYLAGQNGTPEGLANYDYAWGTSGASFSNNTCYATCDMKPLMAIAKFQFNDENGQPIEKATQIIITSLAGELYSKATLNLADGKFSDSTKGSITLSNAAGFPATVYSAFFPSEAQLHFTLTTADGKTYEAATEESINLEQGKIYAHTPLTCSSLAPARVGDYFYNDATWSTVQDYNKTCVGIVYALEDKNGNIDRSATEASRGRVVALKDCKSAIVWALTAGDVEDIENQTSLIDTLTVGSLPYFNGKADSFFSDVTKEQLSQIKIDETTGLITSWHTTGVLADFNGEENSSYIDHNVSAYPTATHCSRYSEGLTGWHLPAAGDLALIWSLQQTGVICNEKQNYFKDFESFGYWTSSEYNESNAWYINFYSGIISNNSKQSNYNSRAVIRF